MTWAGRRAGALLVLVAGLLAGPLPVAGAADDRAGAATDADRVLVVGVPGLTWADVIRRPPRNCGPWRRSPRSARCRCARPAGRLLLDGWATLGAGNRARVPGPDEGLPPVPLPTVPLEGDPADADARPSRPRGGGGAGTGHDAGPLRPPGACRHGRARRSRRRRGAHRRRRGHGPVRRGAGRTRCRRRLRHGVGPGRGPRRRGPRVEITRADNLPSETADPGGALTACPLALVSLDQLTEPGEPGLAQDRRRHRTGPAGGGAHRDRRGRGPAARRRRALPGDTLLLLAGISEVNDGRPSCTSAWPPDPGFPRRLAHLAQHRPGALRPADRRRADRPGGTRARRPPASMNGAPCRRRSAAGAAARRSPSWNGSTRPPPSTTATPACSSGRWSLGRRARRARDPGRSGGALRGPRAPGLRARRPAGVPCGGSPSPPPRCRSRPTSAGLVPWERSGSPLLALVASVLAADAVVRPSRCSGRGGGAGSARRWRCSPLTFGTLVADVFTGSTWSSTGCWATTRSSPAASPATATSPSGSCRSARCASPPRLATALGRRAGPDRARTVTGGTVLAARPPRPSPSSARRGSAATSAASWPRCPGSCCWRCCWRGSGSPWSGWSRPRRRRCSPWARSPSWTGCGRRRTAPTWAGSSSRC